MTTIIYKEEACVPGLADKIVNAKAISYEMPLMPWEPQEREKYQTIAKELFPDWARAGANDSDLYYTKSILVTTNWNRNTDVFDRVETWAARATPTHKPTNIEHDEKRLVGHITDCFGMTLDKQIIPDNIMVDDLPNVYHLVNGAVIYRGWHDQDLATRANLLIEEIEKGQKYVSMECMFRSFSYAVIDPKGESKVVARDENSAWITKHLRAYGGSGEHDGYKFGRLLRNITFSGKGYVNKPANPESIIFSDAGIFDFACCAKENTINKNSGVYLSRTQFKEENRTMAVENTSALEAKLLDLEKQNNALASRLVAMDRISSLIEGGMDRPTATKKVSICASLNDEQFAELSDDLLTSYAKKKEPTKVMNETDKKGVSPGGTSTTDCANSSEPAKDTTGGPKSTLTDGIQCNQEVSGLVIKDRDGGPGEGKSLTDIGGPATSKVDSEDGSNDKNDKTDEEQCKKPAAKGKKVDMKDEGEKDDDKGDYNSKLAKSDEAEATKTSKLTEQFDEQPDTPNGKKALNERSGDGLPKKSPPAQAAERPEDGNTKDDENDEKKKPKTEVVAVEEPKDQDNKDQGRKNIKKQAVADEENETNADESVLDNAKLSDEPNLAAGGEHIDEMAELRLELQRALASRLGIKLNNDNSDEE